MTCQRPLRPTLQLTRERVDSFHSRFGGPPSGPFAPVGSVPRLIGPVRPAGPAPGRASQTMRPAAIAAGLIGRAASSPGRSTSRAIRPPHRIVNHLTKPREPCEHLARCCLRRNRERKKHENEQCRDSYVESCLEGAQRNPPVGVHRRLKTDDLARMLRRFGADLRLADHPTATYSIDGLDTRGRSAVPDRGCRLVGLSKALRNRIPKCDNGRATRTRWAAGPATEGPAEVALAMPSRRRGTSVEHALGVC